MHNNIPSPANSQIIGSKGRSISQNIKTVSVTHHETTKKFVIACQFRNTSFNQKPPRHPEVGVSQSNRQTNTHTVTLTDMATLWLTLPRVRVSDNLKNSNSIFSRARCWKVLWNRLWLFKPLIFIWFFLILSNMFDVFIFFNMEPNQIYFFCKCSLMYYFILNFSLICSTLRSWLH